MVALLPCSCGALIPEIEAPANVYQLAETGPDPELGPTEPWKDVDDKVTREANECQKLLFKGSIEARTTERTSVGLTIGGGALAIAGGLASTVLGLVADQNQDAIKASTVTTAGVAAVGGVISLIASLVRKEKMTTLQKRRNHWDKGYEARYGNQTLAMKGFADCQKGVPPDISQENPDQKPGGGPIVGPRLPPKYGACLPEQKFAITRLKSNSQYALMKCDLQAGENLEVKMRGYPFVTGKRPVDDWGGNLMIRLCFADKNGFEISDTPCYGEVKSPVRGPFVDKQLVKAAESFTVPEAKSVIVKLVNETKAELNFDNLEVEAVRTMK